MKYYKFLVRNITRFYVLYVILFSIIAYVISAYSVSKDYVHSAETCVNYITSNVSEALTYSTNITGFLQEFPSVSEFIASSDTEDMSQNAVAAIDTLRTISYSAADFLSGIALVNLTTNTILTDSGSYQLDFYARRFGLPADELRTTLESFILYGNIRPWMKTSVVEEPTSRRHYLTLILCPGVGQHTMPVIYLYDMDRFFRSASADFDRAAVTLELDGQTIYARTNYRLENLNEELDNRLRYKTVFSSGASTFWYDIEVAYVTRTLDYFISINNFFVLFVFILLAALFMTLYASRRSARHIYAPVNTIMGKLPSSNPASMDEFENIESSISSLLSEKRALTTMVQDYKISLLDQFLISLINGTLSSEEISQGTRSYGLENVRFPLTVCVLECRNYAELARVLDTDTLCGIHATAGYFMEQEFADETFFKVLDMDLKSHILILPFRGYPAMKQTLLSLALKIESCMDLVLKVSFGRAANSFAELSSSFSNALSLQRNMIVASEFAMVLSPSSDTDVSLSGGASYSPEAETAVINQVLSCDLDAACAGSAELISASMGQGVLTKDHHSQLVVMLFATISKILSMLNKTEKDIFGPEISVYLELKQCTTQAQMNAKVRELLSEIISTIKESKLSTDEQTKQTMLDYIHQNYSKSISLLTLASCLNMSQFYVSKQFKQLVGENFKDYLAKYRLEKAIQQFQEDPNVKIKTVAAQVGYNTETFSRTFAKYYGMLPSKYIERMKKE